jgi:quercetin dioxygenase-like cupin family protein
MRLRITRVLVAIVALFALAGAALAAEKKPASKKAPPKLVLWAADDLKWTAGKNGPPGVMMAVLWGDPDKGAHGALHKFPGGFEAPLHHHTSSYRGVVISGTLVVTPEGGTAKSLPSGSYFSAPPMNKHTTKCEGASGCVIFVEATHAWDVVLEGAKK